MILDFPVKYALFDMDGTLTDTMHFWSNIPARLLAAEGLTLAPKEEKKLSENENDFNYILQKKREQMQKKKLSDTSDKK